MRPSAMYVLRLAALVVLSMTASMSFGSPAETGELFGACSIGLPLGVLAAKYIPTLPEEPKDGDRRALYTRLLQGALDDLKITVAPPPGSLLNAGRGQRQYDSINSYFGQIVKQTEARSMSVKYTTGLSLNSAWIILAFHQAPHVNAASMPAFRKGVLAKLDQFVGLAAVASRTCGDDGYKRVATKLREGSDEAGAWFRSVEQARQNDIASEVGRVGKRLADWLVELAGVAMGAASSRIE